MCKSAPTATHRCSLSMRIENLVFTGIPHVDAYANRRSAAANYLGDNELLRLGLGFHAGLAVYSWPLL